MEEYCRKTEQADCWEIFTARILKPALEGTKREPYASMVRRLQVASPREAANRLTTAKKMFARCLRQAIDNYVRGQPEEITEEVAELKRILEQGATWLVRGQDGSHGNKSKESR